MTAKTPIDRELIRRQTLFTALDETWFDKIVNSTRVVTLQENEQLFEHGQPAERFYLVIEGAVKVYRLSEDGNEKIIEIFGPGKSFAEAVMFMEHGRYPASAAALQPSTLYGFDNKTLRTMLCNSNELCLRMLAHLSMRLHFELREIDNLSLQNATFRVVGYLLDLLPDPRADSAIIELNAPKQVIASRLSITPETFSRILRAMTKHNVLTVQGKTIGVHNVRKLREFGRYERVLYSARQ